MMMADDLNAIRGVHCAMSVMKMKTIGLKRVDHFNVAAQLPIVVPGNDYDFATRSEIA